MDEKKDNSPRRKVTLHSFRRFVKGVVSDQAGQDYSEWFLGHNHSVYWTRKEQEHRNIYLKCMPHLTVLDYSQLDTRSKNIETALIEKDKAIQQLRQSDTEKNKQIEEMMHKQEQILSDSSRSQDASLYGFSENEIEKELLDEAEQSYNRFVNAVTNNCINKMPSDSRSSSQVLPLPIIQDGRGNHEILDTGNLSEVNFVYNDFTFQIYPDSELTNERNSETSPRSKENGLDPYNFSQDI